MKTEVLFPKVIVCSPTAHKKKYVFEKWIDAAMSLTYPNYTIRLFDNSGDKGAWCSEMRMMYERKYGKFTSKFDSLYVKTGSRSVVKRMFDASEAMRQYVISKRAEYILHLETDVIPPPDIIEELMCHGKLVIGALYDRDEGAYRKLMIQKIVKEATDSFISANVYPGDEIGFVDGTVKKVSSVGLGAVLIKVDAIRNLPFRYMNDNTFPDQYLAESMNAMNVGVFAHTGVVCEHYNQEWGLKQLGDF